jgi:hypothetical protein
MDESVLPALGEDGVGCRALPWNQRDEDRQAKAAWQRRQR